MTTSSPASPKRPSSMASAASTASAVLCADDHALAGGQAAGLDDDRRALRAQPVGVEIGARERAVGRRSECGGARRNSLVKALEPSSCAGARLRGPKQAQARAPRTASTMPATSGTSGPTMVSCHALRGAPGRPGRRCRRRRRRRCAPWARGGAGVARRDQHLGHARRLRRTSRPARVRGRRRRSISTFMSAGLRAQWRKWRMPVNSIAMPCSSAAAITSASRIEPPGWITAVMPWLGGHVDAVAEREEGVRGHHRAAHLELRRPRLDGGDAAGIDAAHLAGADADRRARRARTRWRWTSRTWPRARRTAGRRSSCVRGLRACVTHVADRAAPTRPASRSCTSTPPPTLLAARSSSPASSPQLAGDQHAHVRLGGQHRARAPGSQRRRHDALRRTAARGSRARCRHRARG